MDAIDLLAFILLVGLAIRSSSRRGWDKTHLPPPEQPITPATWRRS
jgi:hypothetical protein